MKITIKEEGNETPIYEFESTENDSISDIMEQKEKMAVYSDRRIISMHTTFPEGALLDLATEPSNVVFTVHPILETVDA